jgi:hypothetical protein
MQYLTGEFEVINYGWLQIRNKFLSEGDDGKLPTVDCGSTVGRRDTEKTITKMDTDTAVPVPKLFMPHPNLRDDVNRNIVQSEIEGGVYLDNLSDGEVLEVETQNRWYTIVVSRCGKDLISGHPQYCPEPVAVRIEGSTWGGSMLKVRFVGRGMRLEFQHPTYRRIVTSQIVEIRARDPLTSRA